MIVESSRHRWRPLEIAGVLYGFAVPFDIVKNDTLGFSLTVPAGILVILLGAADAVHMHEDQVGGAKVHTRTVSLMLLLLTWTTFTCLWSANQGASILSTAALAQNMLVALVLGRYCRSAWPGILLATAISSAYIAVAVVRAESGLSNRATYNGVDQNTVAFTLCVAFALSLSLVDQAGDWRRRLIPLGCAIACFAAVLLTGSRTGVAATVLTVTVLALTRLRGSVRISRKIGVLGVAACALWILLRLISEGRISDRLTDFSTAGVAGDASRATILDGYFRHFDAWWLIGVGQGADVDFLMQWGGLARNAHGFIWKIWIETGLIGLGLWFALVLGLVWSALRAQSASRIPVLLGVIPIGTFALTLGGQTLSAFWLVVGLCITCAGQQDLSDAKPVEQTAGSMSGKRRSSGL